MLNRWFISSSVEVFSIFSTKNWYVSTFSTKFRHLSTFSTEFRFVSTFLLLGKKISDMLNRWFISSSVEVFSTFSTKNWYVSTFSTKLRHVLTFYTELRYNSTFSTKFRHASFFSTDFWYFRLSRQNFGMLRQKYCFSTPDMFRKKYCSTFSTDIFKKIVFWLRIDKNKNFSKMIDYDRLKSISVFKIIVFFCRFLFYLLLF